LILADPDGEPDQPPNARLILANTPSSEPRL
jgi:hypothetical protein